jgi:hypothetical protein
MAETTFAIILLLVGFSTCALVLVAMSAADAFVSWRQRRRMAK